MTFPLPTRRALCEACTLSGKMKDCPACAFFIESPRATPDDVFRMWTRLWGNLTPAEVQIITGAELAHPALSAQKGVSDGL